MRVISLFGGLLDPADVMLLVVDPCPYAEHMEEVNQAVPALGRFFHATAVLFNSMRFNIPRAYRRSSPYRRRRTTLWVK